MRNLPPVTRNLLIITFLWWLADIVFQKYGIDFTQIFGLHYITATQFHVWQPVTYMFMHANFWHIFCNMFAVMMFGPALEERWGGKRYLIYYMVTGIGAALVQEAVWAIQLQPTLSGYEFDIARKLANQVVTIGASGAVFGILFAFAWLFPDVRMFILFIPIPIRARVMVILYAIFELLEGFSGLPGDNVAHFAHLGGMIFGWLLILWWRHRNYYGFEKTEMEPSHFRLLIRNWWQRTTYSVRQKWLNFKARHPRLFKSKGMHIHQDKSKDYNDYHYHESVK